MPVIVKEASPQALLELALVENLQRQDLGPLEEAFAFKRLGEEFALTQEQIATRVGRSRSAVANSMRLLSLSDEIQASLAKGDITAGHARALLGIDDPDERRRAWLRILEGNLTVRDAEALAKQGVSHRLPPAPKRRSADLDRPRRADARLPGHEGRPYEGAQGRQNRHPLLQRRRAGIDHRPAWLSNSLPVDGEELEPERSMERLEIIEGLKHGPNLVAAEIAGVSDAVLRYRPAEGEWSIKEVVGHLRNAAEVWHKRLYAIRHAHRPQDRRYGTPSSATVKQTGRTPTSRS